MQAIPVYFNPKMLADADSFSPSASKPADVLESWHALGVPMEVRESAAVSDAELCLAHDPGYVHDVLMGVEENGFGTRDLAVARSLPYTSGVMLAAAREAISNGKVAVAPCSGFHHAGYDSARGFCTFNGLIVTAQVLKDAGEAKRVGILDFDQHEGDGTDSIIEHLDLRHVEHYTAGRRFYKSVQAAEFLALIPSVVDAMADCDVILYQAGADPHVDDPLGGWLTTAQLAERDRTVFLAAQAVGVPVAWNLAGGYQSPLRRVLDIHDNTMLACWQVYGSPA